MTEIAEIKSKMKLKLEASQLEVSKYKQEVISLQQKVTDLIIKLQEQLEASQHQVLKYNQDVSFLQQEIAKLKRERDGKSKDLGASRVECKQLIQESTRIKQESDKLKQICRSKTDRITNQVGILEKYKEELKQLQNQNQITSNELEALRLNNKRLRNSSFVCLKKHIENVLKSDQSTQTFRRSCKENHIQTDQPIGADKSTSTEVFNYSIEVQTESEIAEPLTLLEKERDALEQELLDTYAEVNRLKGIKSGEIEL